MIATSANRQVFMQNYSIMGFLSFGNSKKSIRIAELPVYQIENVEDLYRLIPRNSLDGVLFPNIKVAHQERDRLIRYCEQASLKTLVVPEMEELRGGEAKRSVREIRIEDLLGREEIHINLDEIGNLLEGKTVLVTGAAGSIGSEICRQLAHFPIKKLVCFDSAETPMHKSPSGIGREIQGTELCPGDRRCPQSGPCGLCVPQLAPPSGVPCGGLQACPLDGREPLRGDPNKRVRYSCDGGCRCKLWRGEICDDQYG